MTELPKAFLFFESQICDRCGADGPTKNHLCSVCFRLEEEYYQQAESLGIQEDD
jgi:predicted amidophosphoribosyltransferase